MSNTLFESIKLFYKSWGSPSIIPKFIIDNLKHTLYPWQKEALSFFLIYNQKKVKSPHFLFNLGTGSGKTLLMAALILYYYKKGYRHFIFLVHLTNLINKTEINFLSQLHNKYLFNRNIIIDDRNVLIKKVNIFSDNPTCIEILFTTIHGLHSMINNQKENCISLENLYSKDIVIIADEAHHLNADTKQKNKKKPTLLLNMEEEVRNWENTVITKIFHKNNKFNNNKNVLLEFTATIPTIKSVEKKYENKIIYKFLLKDFLNRGYTKVINLISSTLEKKERILHALLLNWYRHKVALKYGISNFKGVILFKSKYIKDSEKDFYDFKEMIRNLKIDDFSFLDTMFRKLDEDKTLYVKTKSSIVQMKSFIKNEGISMHEIVNWIKFAFSIENSTIITHSESHKDNDVKLNYELNNLEDIDNPIRAIFTVNRLTEGWDVLNLFDIVRLYKSQNSSATNNKIPKTTLQEKQLIGRGVRYFPFKYKDYPEYKRKFDDDLTHELRILEELFYYTYDEDSKYISHLTKYLRKDGYIDDNKTSKTFNLKEDFKKTIFYNNAKIWYNTQLTNQVNSHYPLNELKNEFVFSYQINELELSELIISGDKDKDIEVLNLKAKRIKCSLSFKDIEKHIFLKAVNILSKQENSLLRFKNLTKIIKIDSIDDLQLKKHLGDFTLTICGINSYFDLNNKLKLKIVIKFLKKVVQILESKKGRLKGSEFTFCSFKSIFDKPKEKIVQKENIDTNIPKKEWYIMNAFAGTSLEKELVKFIEQWINTLKGKYEYVYLLRNEEKYKIYEFDLGRGFQPDFLLFLKKKNKKEFLQIFIEPKGKHLIDYDSWKEEFLMEISRRYGLNSKLEIENDKYILIGFPFFNSQDDKKKDNLKQNSRKP